MAVEILEKHKLEDKYYLVYDNVGNIFNEMNNFEKALEYHWIANKLAEKNNVNLEFEASVAGGIPILRSIKEGLATNKLSKVYGILNL